MISVPVIDAGSREAIALEVAMEATVGEMDVERPSAAAPVRGPAPAPASGHGDATDATDRVLERHGAAIAPPLIAVPVRKVRFLQALAEDGPGARPCRTDGFPVQRVTQRTTC